MKVRFSLAAVLAAVLAASVGLGAGEAQTLEVKPAQVLTDETATVRAAGLKPGAQVSIRAELTDGDGKPWAAEAQFVADANGAVDTAAQAPVKGSYRVASAMGLVWSMTPAAKDVHIYRPPPVLGAQAITFHLMVDGKEAAAAQLEQIAVAAGVKQVKLEGALVGKLFLPPDEGKHPAVLVLSGSNGGMPAERAAWLASRGYAALALCYFKCEGRPKELENIPLEYFGEALGWMMKQPQVDPERMAVMGVSRGGELSLQLGSMFPVLKAVVAYVPANVRNRSCCGGMPTAAWTWQGQPLSYLMPRMRDNPQAQMLAAIAVERTHGPILMIGAKDDGVWPSEEMVNAAAARLRGAHFSYPVVTLIYDHAGHRAGTPEIMPTWDKDSRPQAMFGTATDYGGTVEGNAMSTLDAIPKVLKFLHDALGVKN